MTEEAKVEGTADTDKIELETLFGVKAGMTRIFTDNGTHVPVTIIKLIKNVISQVKTKEIDGYESYQVSYYEKREKLINKPQAGHLAKANLAKVFARSAEVKVDGVVAENLGKEISLDLLKPGTFVDVTGTSKGKGFQGVIKRYNFSGGPAAHGSHFHRTTGSIGNRATPGRVFPGKKMPGHMGDKKVTVQNIKIVEVNKEKGYMLIKGSLPGSKNLH